MKDIVENLQYCEQFNCEIAIAELFDSHYCYDKHLFISVCM